MLLHYTRRIGKLYLIWKLRKYAYNKCYIDLKKRINVLILANKYSIHLHKLSNNADFKWGSRDDSIE